MRAELARRAERGAGSLRSGRRRSRSPVADDESSTVRDRSSDPVLMPDLPSDRTYQESSTQEDVTSDPFTTYDSDPPEMKAAIQAANQAYQKEIKSAEKLREDASTEVLLNELRQNPNKCKEVLKSVDFVTDGWCKLAKKAGNVSTEPFSFNWTKRFSLARWVCSDLLGRLWRTRPHPGAPCCTLG